MVKANDPDRAQPGDIFTIPVGDGRYYLAAITGDHSVNQHHVVVFDSVLTDDDRGVERLEGAMPIFSALVLDTFLVGGQWKVIGRTEDDLSRYLPAYRVSMAPDEWYAESFDAKRRRLASAVEIEALPLRTTWSAAVLQRAVRAREGLEPWLDVFDRIVFRQHVLSRDLFPD